MDRGVETHRCRSAVSRGTRFGDALGVGLGVVGAEPAGDGETCGAEAQAAATRIVAIAMAAIRPGCGPMLRRSFVGAP